MANLNPQNTFHQYKLRIIAKNQTPQFGISIPKDIAIKYQVAQG